MTYPPIGAGRLLVVDDHELVGSCLVRALRTEGEDAYHHRPLSAADIAPAAFPAGPGLVVLDLDLGRDRDGEVIDGAAAVPVLVGLGWRVLVLSGTSDGARVGAALAAGGFGWAHKNAPFPALLATIREARAGRAVMPPGRRERLVAQHELRVAQDREPAQRLALLSAREREVLAALAAGKRVRAVAEHHAVPVATVRTHIRSVLTKLAVGSRPEAVAVFRTGAAPPGWR